jgi:hypothetical protein
MAGHGPALRTKTLSALVAVGSLLAVCGCTGGPGEPSDAAGPSPTSTTESPTRPTPTPHVTESSPTPVPMTPPDPAPPPDPTPPTQTAPPPAPDPVPPFQSSVTAITPELAARMSASWRPGCPVPLEQLRYVTVSHRAFDGTTAVGELVVHADVADGLVAVFADLYHSGYPIRLMRLVDDFGADDGASGAADNTAAFNCRAVTGGTHWSEHAFGRAIDVNPLENPYVLGDFVSPPAGAAFLDRPDLPGVLHRGDAAVTAFAARGWHWGGEWRRPVDYQHFSTTGR